jgi:predicted TIM-barrel fold metal-dependent hydrolase
MQSPMPASKIVDFHVHIGFKKDWHPWVHDLMKKADPVQFERLDSMMTPKNLEEFLRDQGVDFAVILADNSPITTGVVTNEFVAKFCKGHDFFVPFCSIHPFKDDIVKETKRCIQELGFRGIKMYPTAQHFYPNDENVYPLYETAQDLKVPIMFHTGSSVFKGSKLKYGEPKLLDDVAVDFPSLKIVMAHSGRGAWYPEAALMAMLHPNVFMEVSGLPPKNLLRYFPNLEKVEGKVIFGSDWPTISDICGNIKTIKDLGLSKKMVEGILGGTALRVLGLASK